MIDPWSSGPLDDGPPFAGVAALLAGSLAAAAGVLLTAAVVLAGTWVRNRLRWPAP